MPRRKSKLETIEVPEPEVSIEIPEVSIEIPEVTIVDTDTNPEEIPEVSTIETDTDSEIPVVVEVIPVVNHDVILPRSASKYVPPLR